MQELGPATVSFGSILASVVQKTEALRRAIDSLRYFDPWSASLDLQNAISYGNKPCQKGGRLRDHDGGTVYQLYQCNKGECVSAGANQPCDSGMLWKLGGRCKPQPPSRRPRVSAPIASGEPHASATASHRAIRSIRRGRAPRVMELVGPRYLRQPCVQAAVDADRLHGEFEATFHCGAAYCCIGTDRTPIAPHPASDTRIIARRDHPIRKANHPMQRICWIPTLGVLLVAACGVPAGSTNSQQASTIDETLQPPEASMATTRPKTTSCFASCLHECMIDLGCNSLPPAERQQCGTVCVESCHCECGPPSLCQ